MSGQCLLRASARHAFLEALTGRHRKILESGMQPFSAEAGDFLARIDEPAEKFYLIQSGHVTLGIPTPESGLVAAQTLGPGDVIGWSWLVPPHRWKFQCQAASPVQGIAFDGEWLRAKCEEDHELGYQVLKELLAVVAGRLTAARMQLMKLYV